MYLNPRHLTLNGNSSYPIIFSLLTQEFCHVSSFDSEIGLPVFFV